MIEKLLLDRRQMIAALTTSVAAGALGAFSAHAAPDTPSWMVAPSMSRCAAIFDAMTLLVGDSDVSGDWQAAILPMPKGKPWGFSYAYGAGSIGKDASVIEEMVSNIHSGWETRDRPGYGDIQRFEGDMIERQLVIALGWAANAGATAVFSGQIGPEPERWLETDAAYVRALIGEGPFEASVIERRIRLLYERAFIAMHTVEPDLEDVNGWLDRYAAWALGLDERARRLAEAIAAGKLPELPNGVPFYSPSEIVMTRTKGLLSGTAAVKDPGWADALEAESIYGDAVLAAYRNARSVMDGAQGNAPLRRVRAQLTE